MCIRDRPFLDARTMAKVAAARAASPAELRAHAAVAGLGLREGALRFLCAAAFGSAPRPGTLPPLPAEAAGLPLSARLAVEGEAPALDV